MEDKRELLLDEVTAGVEEPTEGGPLGAEVAFTTGSPERNRFLAEIRARKAERQSDTDIQESLGLPDNLFRSLMREFYQREEPNVAGKPNGQVYVDYVLQQRRVMRDLDLLTNGLTIDTSSREAAEEGLLVTIEPRVRLGALKAKSEIIDKIIEKGQSLGVIEKAPERREVRVAGVLIGQMDARGVRGVILDQLKGLKRIEREYGGDADILDEPEANRPQLSAAPTTPQFSENGRPRFARGGTSKVAGAKAVVQRRRSTEPPPR